MGAAGTLRPRAARTNAGENTVSTHAGPTVRTTTSTRRWVICAIAAALLIAGGVVGIVERSGVASAAPVGAEGCGYGTGGPFADTLCWIDMTDYDYALSSGAGQPMSVELPGGYTVDFTVRTTGIRPVVASAFPTWTFGDGEGAPVGNRIYLDTPGQPALYQTTGAGDATTIELDDIEVRDAGGNSVSGWRLVGVDAEATDITESITFTSSGPVSVLATYDRDGEATNGCQFTVEQIDANTIRCTGSGIGDAYGTLLVGATAPTSFSQTMTVSNFVSREGVAFAIQTSTIDLGVQVDSRHEDSDSFTVAVVSPEDAVVGGGDTGTSGGASTGALVVLPRVDGSAYTLRISGGDGTDLGDYGTSWSCTRDGATDPSLAVTGVDSIEVSPSAGEEIACTVVVSVGGSTGPGGAANPVAGTPRFTG